MTIPLLRGFNAVALTTTGPPTTGTWAVGDVVADSAGAYWRCTVAGTPGTWVALGGGTLAGNRGVTADAALRSTDARVRGPFTINYIDNPSAEIDTTGWTAYADAAGTAPVDGTGGAGSITVSRQTSAPMRGPAKLRISKGASNLQGHGISTDSLAVLDGADVNRPLTLAFDVDPTNFGGGEFSVWVYDTNNAVLLPISGNNTISAGGRFVCQVSTRTSSYNLRVIFHCHSTSATAQTLDVAGIYLGPVWLPSAPAMSDWQDGGAVTITATTTNPTKGTIVRDKVWWRRVGDSAEIRVEYEHSTAGGAGSGDYLLTIPAGLVIDTTKVIASATVDSGVAKPRGILGTAVVSNGTSQVLVGGVRVYDSTRVGLVGIGDTGIDDNWRSAAIAMSNAAIHVTASFLVPIAGWSGTTPVQQGSRYLWAQRFASPTRVTTTPTQPGQYRARRNGVDTAPTTGPTAADGFRVDANSTIAAGRINQYDIFVGTGKTVQLQASLNTGRSGILCPDLYAVGSATRGMMTSYDPSTGVFSVYCAIAGTGDCVGVGEAIGSTPITGYFDLLVADDPVAVAQAPAVHVEATSDAGQVVTANTEDLDYEDEVVDTHGAWSGSLFTAPVPGVYQLNASASFTSTTNPSIIIFKNGTEVHRGATRTANAQGVASVAGAVRLAAGDTMSVRCIESLTRGTVVASNRLSITRIGDA